MESCTRATICLHNSGSLTGPHIPNGNPGSRDGPFVLCIETVAFEMCVFFQNRLHLGLVNSRNQWNTKVNLIDDNGLVFYNAFKHYLSHTETMEG